jgi:hypothetical protein
MWRPVAVVRVFRQLIRRPEQKEATMGELTRLVSAFTALPVTIEKLLMVTVCTASPRAVW